MLGLGLRLAVSGEAGLPSPGILLIVVGHAPAQLSATPGATKVTAFNTTPLFSCGSGCAGHYGVTASSMDLLLSVIALTLLAPLTAGIAELGFFVVHGPPATISGQDKAFTSAGALLIIGLTTAGPWLTMAGARALARRTSSPSGLIAARRLADDLTLAKVTWPAANVTAAQLAALPLGSLNVATNGSTSAIEQARTVLDQAYPFLQAPKTLGDKSSAAQIEGYEQLFNVVILASLVIAGCALAASVAGGLADRKRPFGLLRLTGARLAMLQASAHHIVRALRMGLAKA
jgi:hypothetical protein